MRLADRRLPRVKYEWSPLARTRWLNTRFHPYVVTYHSAAAKRPSAELLTKVNEFEFDCVLTVAHGFGWLAASALAEYRSVPLHLIVHDDWPRAAHVPTIFRSWLDRSFAKTYRQAQSRMCISPTMKDCYRHKYGVDGDVLYPMRQSGGPKFVREFDYECAGTSIHVTDAVDTSLVKPRPRKYDTAGAASTNTNTSANTNIAKIT